MLLPQNKKLSVPRLSRVFDKTVATYKFYWFVVLLDIVVKERKTKMSFWEVIAGMVAESWYPIHYFKLSFGKSDSLYVQSLALQQELNITIDVVHLAPKGRWYCKFDKQRTLLTAAVLL